MTDLSQGTGWKKMTRDLVISLSYETVLLSGENIRVTGKVLKTRVGINLQSACHIDKKGAAVF